MGEGWGRLAGDVEGLPITTYTGRRSTKVYLFRDRPFHLFFFVCLFLFLFLFFFFNFSHGQAKETTGKNVLILRLNFTVFK